MDKWRDRFQNVQYQRAPCECNCVLLEGQQTPPRKNHADSSVSDLKLYSSSIKLAQNHKNAPEKHYRTNLNINVVSSLKGIVESKDRASLSMEQPKKKLSVSGLQKRKSKDITIELNRPGNSRQKITSEYQQQHLSHRLPVNQPVQMTSEFPLNVSTKTAKPSLVDNRPQLYLNNNNNNINTRQFLQAGQVPSEYIHGYRVTAPPRSQYQGIEMLGSVLTPSGKRRNAQKPLKVQDKQVAQDISKPESLAPCQPNDALRRSADPFRPNIVFRSNLQADPVMTTSLQIPHLNMKHIGSSKLDNRNHAVEKTTTSTHYPHSQNFIASIANSYLSNNGEQTDARLLQTGTANQDDFVNYAQARTVKTSIIEEMEDNTYNNHARHRLFKYGPMKMSADCHTIPLRKNNKTIESTRRFEEHLSQQNQLHYTNIAGQYYLSSWLLKPSQTAIKKQLGGSLNSFTTPILVQEGEHENTYTIQTFYERRKQQQQASLHNNDPHLPKNNPQDQPITTLVLKDVQSIVDEENDFNRKFRRIQSINDEDDYSRTDDNVSIVVAQYNPEAKALMHVRRNIVARQSEPLQPTVTQGPSFGRLPAQKTDR